MRLILKPIILLLAFLSLVARGDDTVMELELAKPTFVLPQFTGPYREREASVAPEEYEMADRLRTLLDSNQRQQVLDELAKFYDIELSPAMLTLKAQVYFTLEMYDEALETYKMVLSRKPELVRVHADLGQLYLIRNDFQKAREHFAKAISFGSNSAMIHGQLGYLNLSQHGPFSAIASYQQAMALEPNNLQWQQGLLAALSQAQMYTAAQALLDQLLESRPFDTELWLNKAALSLSTQQTQQALAAIEMAILLGEDSNRNLKVAAQLHLQLNSFARALELITQHINQTELDMVMLDEYLSWLTQTNMWAQAEKLLDNIAPQIQRLSLKEQSLYYARRAQIHHLQKNVSQAEDFYHLALEKDPTNGGALIGFAEFSSEQKQYTRAELLYVRAEAIEEVEKFALLGRAQVYILIEDYTSALRELTKAYQKFPELIELKDKIEAIEHIKRTREQINQ